MSLDCRRRRQTRLWVAATTLLLAALDSTHANLVERGLDAAASRPFILPRAPAKPTPGPSRRHQQEEEEVLLPRWEASTLWTTASVTVTATSQLTTMAYATETATATASMAYPSTVTVYQTTTSTETVTVTATAPGPPPKATCCVAAGHLGHRRRAMLMGGRPFGEDLKPRQAVAKPTSAPVILAARSQATAAALVVRDNDDGTPCVYTTLTSTAYATTTRTKLEMATATSTHTMTITLSNAPPAAPLPTSPPAEAPCDNWCDATYPPATSQPPPPPPPSPPHPHHDKTPKPIPDNGICGKVVAWVLFIYGGVPKKGADFFPSLIFFFAYCFFAAVAAHRLFGWGRYNKDIFSNLVPTLLASLVLMCWCANRAYTSNSTPDIPHVLASHTMFIIAGPLLMDSSLQLFGLLSKRANPGGWIDASSIFLRLLNLTAEVLSIVSAAQLVSWLNAWKDGVADCYSPLLKSIATLPLVADFLLLFISIGGLLAVVLARLRNFMEFPVLIHQASLFLVLTVHSIWRLIRDTRASSVSMSGLSDWLPPAYPGDVPSPASQGGSFGVKPDNSPDWEELRRAREGAECAPIFWLMGFLSLLLATMLLLAANLLTYVNAEEPPLADADCARYKLCFNETTGKMELQLVENPGPPVLPNGQPLYELVRGDDGEWNVRPAEGPTILPREGDWITMKPWYH